MSCAGSGRRCPKAGGGRRTNAAQKGRQAVSTTQKLIEALNDAKGLLAHAGCPTYFIDTAIAAAKQEQQAEPDREYWMIECKNGFIGWWTGGERCDCRFFNTDPNKGRRFDTKEEAEKVIATIGNSCQIATSHSWIDRGNPPVQQAEPDDDVSPLKDRALYALQTLQTDKHLPPTVRENMFDCVREAIQAAQPAPEVPVDESIADLARYIQILCRESKNDC